MAITQYTEYGDEHGQYEGMLVYPEDSTGELPCVLIFPTVWGCTSMEEKAAQDLAALGYAALVVDIYGKGFDASTREAAFGRMAEYNADRRFLLTRLQLVYQTAQSLAQVNAEKIAAIGYCFGGKCVMDLARSGESFVAGASFHGVLDAPDFDQDTAITTPLLVLHGWDDPIALPADVVALGQEFTHKGADWELVAYGKTGHAFMKPEAGDKAGGYYYNASSADRAWQRMVSFLSEMFV